VVLLMAQEKSGNLVCLIKKNVQLRELLGVDPVNMIFMGNYGLTLDVKVLF